MTPHNVNLLDTQPVFSFVTPSFFRVRLPWYNALLSLKMFAGPGNELIAIYTRLDIYFHGLHCLTQLKMVRVTHLLTHLICVTHLILNLQNNGSLPNHQQI